MYNVIIAFEVRKMLLISEVIVSLLSFHYITTSTGFAARNPTQELKRLMFIIEMSEIATEDTTRAACIIHIRGFRSEII